MSLEGSYDPSKAGLHTFTLPQGLGEVGFWVDDHGIVQITIELLEQMLLETPNLAPGVWEKVSPEIVNEELTERLNSAKIEE